MSGAGCQVSGARCQVLGARCQRPDVRDSELRSQHLCAKRLSNGCPFSVVNGPWSVVRRDKTLKSRGHVLKGQRTTDNGPEFSRLTT